MDKNEEIINDMKSSGVSNCCGASVINGVCLDCKEFCDVEYEEEEVVEDLQDIITKDQVDLDLHNEKVQNHI